MSLTSLSHSSLNRTHFGSSFSTLKSSKTRSRICPPISHRDGLSLSVRTSLFSFLVLFVAIAFLLVAGRTVIRHAVD